MLRNLLSSLLCHPIVEGFKVLWGLEDYGGQTDVVVKLASSSISGGAITSNAVGLDFAVIKLVPVYLLYY